MTEKLAPGSGCCSPGRAAVAWAAWKAWKHSPWAWKASGRSGCALAAVAHGVPQLESLDLARLEGRAREQHRRVEALRLEAARATLAPPGS